MVPVVRVDGVDPAAKFVLSGSVLADAYLGNITMVWQCSSSLRDCFLPTDFYLVRSGTTRAFAR